MTDPPLNDPVPPEHFAEARRTVAALIAAKIADDHEGWAVLGRLDDDEAVLVLHQLAMLAADLVELRYGPLGKVEDFLGWYRHSYDGAAS